MIEYKDNVVLWGIVLEKKNEHILVRQLEKECWVYFRGMERLLFC